MGEGAARQSLRLPDGRRLDYLELGDPDGVPALYLHGTPSSASEARWLHEPSRAHGVRLVAFDRPGYLESEQRRPATLLGTAGDFAAAGAMLGLDRFAVIGFSGGAGYALATAHLAPDAVTVVHLGGGIGSLAGEGWSELPRARRFAFKLVTRAPGISRVLLGATFGLLRRGIEKRLDSPADAARWFFDGPARGAQIAAVAEYAEVTPAGDLRGELSDFAAGTRATRAVIDDLMNYVQPWPFDLGSVRTPVELWHGLDDPAAPVSFARREASELPNANANLFEGEGHFVFHTHGAEIAASIRRHAA